MVHKNKGQIACVVHGYECEGACVAHRNEG